jgi:5-formyltetrahydrofolate cyclo-ligase
LDADLTSQKAALRRRMRALRRRLAAARCAAATQAADHAPIGRWTSLGVAASYLAAPEEFDPRVLNARLSAAGLRLALPVVVARGEPLVFRAAEGAVLAADAAGIPAPDARAPSLTPRLVLAPLLAFDRRGGRLGQGGGYYDRTLAALRAAGPVLVVGVGFAGQQVDEVPMGPADERLDAVLTENGYMEP